VALIALQIRVSASQRESNSVVIKAGRLPSCRRVTFLTCLGQTECDVIRIRRLLEICQVAAYARSRRSLVLSSHVASKASQRGMHARESETR
jgi:hypothetical protein